MAVRDRPSFRPAARALESGFLEHEHEAIGLADHRALVRDLVARIVRAAQEVALPDALQAERFEILLCERFVDAVNILRRGAPRFRLRRVIDDEHDTARL